MAKRWESRWESVDRRPSAAMLEAPDAAMDEANAVDETLQQTAQMLLRTSPFQELHALDVVIDDHALRLRGQVMSYFHKQIAQETIRSVAPGVIVENELEVHPGHRLH
ncbi:MAG: hypothetical protein ACK5OB_01130 [Pirellula sp.]|jgi:hypothetical protein